MNLCSLLYWFIRSYFGRINYQAYLNSRAWKHKRQVVLWWASYRCQLCYTDKRPLDVHHRTYCRLGKERLTDLIVLCRQDHEQFHHKTFNFEGN